MKPTDFAYHMTRFFSQHLPGRKGASKNTIASYRDSFYLFIIFMSEAKGIKAEKLQLKDFTQKNVEDFLNWLENDRGCTTSTRNVRLAALHSFFRYMQYEIPDGLNQWQEILAISTKKESQKHMNYVGLDGMKLLLSKPDKSTKSGRRDLALLSLMYDTGARVQEIADLTVGMVRLESPATVKLIGKGAKARIVPVMDAQVSILKTYLIENNLLTPENNLTPLFRNRAGEKLTRAGIGYILQKYVKMAYECDPLLFPIDFSCHCMRHSKAMHLLQSGVNLVYIRDILGHASIQTTEIYARADSEQKRKALEKAHHTIAPDLGAQWQENKDLLGWLKSF